MRSRLSRVSCANAGMMCARLSPTLQSSSSRRCRRVKAANALQSGTICVSVTVSVSRRVSAARACRSAMSSDVAVSCTQRNAGSERAKPRTGAAGFELARHSVALDSEACRSSWHVSATMRAVPSLQCSRESSLARRQVGRSSRVGRWAAAGCEAGRGMVLGTCCISLHHWTRSGALWTCVDPSTLQLLARDVHF